MLEKLLKVGKFHCGPLPEYGWENPEREEIKYMCVCMYVCMCARSPQNADHADCRLQTADRADHADCADCAD